MYRIFRGIGRTHYFGLSTTSYTVTLFNAHLRHNMPYRSSQDGLGEICRHYIYKASRTPVIGQTLDVQMDSNNGHDRYAVSTLLNNSVVGQFTEGIFKDSMVLLMA